MSEARGGAKGFANWWDRTVVSRNVKFGCATADIMALRPDVVPRRRCGCPSWDAVAGSISGSTIRRADLAAEPVGQRYARGKPSIPGWFEWGVAVKLP